MKQPAPPPKIPPQSSATTEKTGPPQAPNYVVDKGFFSLPLRRAVGQGADGGARRASRSILTKSRTERHGRFFACSSLKANQSVSARGGTVVKIKRLTPDWLAAVGAFEARVDVRNNRSFAEGLANAPDRTPCCRSLTPTRTPSGGRRGGYRAAHVRRAPPAQMLQTSAQGRDASDGSVNYRSASDTALLPS